MAKTYSGIALIAIALIAYGCRSSVLDDPVAIIRFNVQQRSHVKLTIENSYNSVVATLVDEVRDAGSYSVVFGADSLFEGVYFYTVECKGVDSAYYSKSTSQFLVIKI
ncbi:MAG: hypothetical protein HY961_03345 [Ignavibacteriae bacterium]|nr:hypothetical protein [Ignavibacteriota bacterium]